LILGLHRCQCPSQQVAELDDGDGVRGRVDYQRENAGLAGLVEGVQLDCVSRQLMEMPAPPVRDMREAARSEEVFKRRAPVRIPLTTRQHLGPEPLKAVFDGFRSDVLGRGPPLQLLSLGDPEPNPATATIDTAGADGPFEVGKSSHDQATGQLIPRISGVPRFHDRPKQFARRQVSDVTRSNGWRQVSGGDDTGNGAHTPYVSGHSSFLTRLAVGVRVMNCIEVPDSYWMRQDTRHDLRVTSACDLSAVVTWLVS
jgi:hypothetical protein